MAPHRAVIIVDVQRAFSPPPSYLRKLERYIRTFECRIFTRFINPPGSMFRRVLKRKSCPPHSPESELALPVGPGDLVLEKVGRYGLSTAQMRHLHRRRIRKIVVCGMDTDACVLGVMFSLFDAGIECHVKSELCISSSGLHAEALAVAREQFKPMRRRPKSRGLG